MPVETIAQPRRDGWPACREKRTRTSQFQFLSPRVFLSAVTVAAILRSDSRTRETSVGSVACVSFVFLSLGIFISIARRYGPWMNKSILDHTRSLRDKEERSGAVRKETTERRSDAHKRTDEAG